MDWMLDHYRWIKALHVVSAIAWMAGLLYLPRLFVYHAGAERGSVQEETFRIMERRLFRAIMNPAMIATWVFGGSMLAVNPGLWSELWMYAKLVCIVSMTVFHHALGRWRKAFLCAENRKTERFFRVVNEVPAVLMILIVVLAVVEPF